MCYHEKYAALAIQPKIPYVYPMNRHPIASGIAFFLVFLLVSFRPASSADYTVDVQRSALSWEGHKFFGGKHTGTIALREGQCTVVDDKLTGGRFIIDMNSIQVTDLTGETAAKLTNHLKTADFFDAANFPEATFVIKRVEYGNANSAAVLGDLTIRGITQEVAFLATIEIVDGKLKAVAPEIRVDRTVHEAKYGSVRFFQDLGRKIVSDEFTLALEIHATL